MRVEVIKVLVLVALFILTFTLGYIPIALINVFKRLKKQRHESKKFNRFERGLSLLSCYAAGVFLATCLLDLLPDVRSNLDKVFTEMKMDVSFPVAECIMALGLFFVLIVEQIVLSIKESQLAKSSSHQPLLPSDENARLRAESSLSEHSITGISDEPQRPRVVFTPNVEIDSESDNEEVHPIIPDQTGDVHIEERQQSSLRSLLLLLALSLHSIFEGLAVGLQKYEGDVLGIFAALLLHKSILSFSLGTNLMQSRLSKWAAVKSILFFSLTAPVGIAVGIGIIGLWDSVSSNLVQGILQGIASGTFLYVTFFEVLPHEFNSSDARLAKLVFLLLGFATVTGILFLH